MSCGSHSPPVSQGAVYATEQDQGGRGGGENPPPNYLRSFVLFNLACGEREFSPECGGVLVGLILFEARTLLRLEESHYSSFFGHVHMVRLFSFF